MNPNTSIWLSVQIAALLIGAGCERTEPADSAEEHAEPERPSGPHGGMLLAEDDFAIELAIFEAGVAPELRAWATLAGEALAPATVELTVELTRLDGRVDRISFAPAADYLRGDREIEEPHSFDVAIAVTHAGRAYRWAYESHEGRTTILADVARAAGIETDTAGPGVILESLSLYGSIVPDTTRVREVDARFPGIIRAVRRQVGERVAAGDALVTIESNESLQTYTLTAPIAGVVTARHAEPGEQTGVERLFEIADLSTVWAELSVFARDRARVRTGHAVELTAEGGVTGEGAIDYLAPLGDRASQSVTARVVLENSDGRWTPGQFVTATVTIDETAVPLAVPLAALQTFRDFDVVFARVGDTYEVRMLELGRRDAERVEVLDGLAPGTVYVTANSYLVKADIEKAGASHDH